MGILLTVVDDPTPLTKLLDSEVEESKRKRWAKESARIMGILHENDIVWGDAKADNFMVDSKDDLWIIDFGGSYTKGWVDPEKMETMEGDDEGTEKIVNALKDPDGATVAMEEENKEEEEQERRSVSADQNRRKRDREEEEKDLEEPASKAARRRESL